MLELALAYLLLVQLLIGRQACSIFLAPDFVWSYIAIVYFLLDYFFYLCLFSRIVFLDNAPWSIWSNMMIW